VVQWGHLVVLTEVNTSWVCWMVAILVQPNFLKSFTLVGLCRVADGWVRKNVGKRLVLDKAGELDPYESCNSKTGADYGYICLVHLECVGKVMDSG